MGINSKFTGIPTKKNFIEYTEIYILGHHCKRDNPFLLQIDAVLDYYHEAMVKTPQKTNTIIAACCIYLESKRKARSCRRRAAILRLIDNAIGHLKTQLRDVDQIDTLRKEKKWQDLQTYITGELDERIQREVNSHRLREIDKKFGICQNGNGGVMVHRDLAVDCIDWLMQNNCMISLNEMIQDRLNDTLLKLYRLFPDIDLSTERSLLELRTYLMQLNVLRAISRMRPHTPLDNMNLNPTGKKILGALRRNLGDFRRGRALGTQYWSETIGVGEEKNVHLYGGGVAFQTMKHEVGFKGGLARGENFAKWEGNEYREKASELLEKAKTDPNALKQIQNFGGTSRGGTIVIKYFDDEDRRAHQAHNRNGLFVTIQQENGENEGSDNENQVTTPISIEYSNMSSGDLYAMSLNENFFVVQDEILEKFDNTQTRHSSLLGGKACLCAGNIWIYQGKLLAIDNDSGHYKPSRHDLIKCLSVLKNKYRVDLSNIFVSDATLGLKSSKGELLMFWGDHYARNFGRVTIGDSVTFSDWGDDGYLDKNAVKKSHLILELFRHPDRLTTYRNA